MQFTTDLFPYEITKFRIIFTSFFGPLLNTDLGINSLLYIK